ncbi:MAG: glycosyltransferase [Planctomycetota bacterium]
MPEKDNNFITVSVVTGRHPEHLAGCLTSFTSAAQRTPLDVYLIDNLALFDVAKVARQNYPAAKVIKNSEQKGFGANHNQVLKQCRTKYVLILNDDIQLDKNCIDLMHQFMESHPEAGLTGVALYEGNWDNNAQTGGGLIKTSLPAPIKVILVTIAKALGAYNLIKKYVGHKQIPVTQPLGLSFVSGACLMARKKMLDEIGYFDENFYMYFEDIDLGMRARQAGWQCYQVPGAKIVHMELASVSARTYKWIAQSAQYFAVKYHSRISQTFICLMAIFLRIISLRQTKSATWENRVAPDSRSQSQIRSSKPLKLLFMADTFILGFSRYFFEACQYLVRQGHQITILGGHPDKHIPQTRTIDHISLRQYYLEEARARLNPVRIILKILAHNYRLFGEIQKTGPLDGIVFWQPLSALGVWLHPRSRNIPKSYFFLCPWHKEYALNVRLDEIKRYTPQFIWHYLNAQLRKWIERLVIQGCRRIIVMSDFARHELLETHPVNPSRIVFVPGAVNPDEYKPLGSKPEQKQKLNLSPDKFVLFTIRRLVPRMGLENLINAMPLIIKANPRVYLIVGGIGPLMNPLKELTRSLGIEKFVRLEGLIDRAQLPSYYNVADLFILPTKDLEGFGLVTIESLACGTPVLGTPVAATREILGKLNPNLLFKSVSSEDMSDLIIEFSNKPVPELTGLGRQGRAFVLANYTWDIVGPKIEQVCKVAGVEL